MVTAVRWTKKTTYLVDDRLWLVVLAGIVKHLHKVGHHVLHAVVLIGQQLLLDPLHVHWLLDHLVVVRVVL